MALFKLVAILLVVLNVSIAEEGKAPTVRLNDGYNIPLLGLGTFGTNKDIEKMRQAVYWAIEAGYRHIDTAAYYRNEAQIGEAIKEAVEKGLVKRDELFITTKLWNDKHARDDVVPALKESLSKLGLDYVDLYLIHSPWSTKADGSSDNIDIIDTWQGMEEAQKLGLVRSIGVSNFNTEQLDRIIANGTVVPAVNQIEVHPSLTEESLVADCQARNITVTAYSPLGFLVSRNVKDSPPLTRDNPILVKIAEKHGKTTSQVVLRYSIDRYLIPIPKSVNKERIIQNIDVFDFRLDDEDIAEISKFNVNKRIFT